MASSTGGTAVMAGRRFTATATTTTSSPNPGRILAGRGRVERWDMGTTAVSLRGETMKVTPTRCHTVGCQVRSRRPGSADGQVEEAVALLATAVTEAMGTVISPGPGRR
jgi:hypothetical protein